MGNPVGESPWGTPLGEPRGTTFGNLNWGTPLVDPFGYPHCYPLIIVVGPFWGTPLRASLGEPPWESFGDPPWWPLLGGPLDCSPLGTALRGTAVGNPFLVPPFVDPSFEDTRRTASREQPPGTNIGKSPWGYPYSGPPFRILVLEPPLWDPPSGTSLVEPLSGTALRGHPLGTTLK